MRELTLSFLLEEPLSEDSEERRVQKIARHAKLYGQSGPALIEWIKSQRGYHNAQNEANLR